MTTRANCAKILFAGGGTGGHLFPAVAIANRISELLKGSGGVEIAFVGTPRGIEYRLRESLGYPLHLINIRGLVRSFSLTNLLVPFLVISSLIKCSLLIKRFRPHVVVGTGGYVSWPLLKSAGWKQVPTVLQEQNSYPGLVTRRMADQAARVYVGFAGAVDHLPSSTEITITGNPVRRTLLNGNKEEARRSFGLHEQKKTILVLGGSQGARSINQAVIKSLAHNPLGEKYQLLWQTGKRDYKDVVAQVNGQDNRISLFPFAEDMSLVYAAADFAVARAGALTLAELEACRVPALVIPYPHATADHQRKNAAESATRGVAEVIDPDELAGVDLLGRAVTLLEEGAAERMQKTIERGQAGRKLAVDQIAEGIIALVRQQQEAEIEC